MLWVPTARLLVLQAAVLLLPAPVSATAAQPAIELPPSVKLTVPVGLLPVTVAVNATLVPTVAGLAELVSVVVVGDGPPLAVHASTSVMRDQVLSALVTLMRMRSVV